MAFCFQLFEKQLRMQASGKKPEHHLIIGVIIQAFKDLLLPIRISNITNKPRKMDVRRREDAQKFMKDDRLRVWCKCVGLRYTAVMDQFETARVFCTMADKISPSTPA